MTEWHHHQGGRRRSGRYPAWNLHGSGSFLAVWRMLSVLFAAGVFARAGSTSAERRTDGSAPAAIISSCNGFPFTRSMYTGRE